MDSRHIKILDTTLRDGQQCPGAGMAFAQNLEYAQLGIKVGLDVMEAGFPAASDGDFLIVNTIVRECTDPKHRTTFSALCQLREAQIVRTMEALEPGLANQQARLHTYLPVDPHLMVASLGSYAQKTEQILQDVQQLCAIASKAGFEVEFSPEGYSRMGDNFDFVTDVIRAAISGGVTIINCPDTIGGACRLQGDDYFVNKMAKHKQMMSKEFPEKQITWSMHCHNDFGLALDNSMAGVFSGVATQVEGCINGIGERAGNAALEQCIMYIKHFGRYFDPENPLYTTINTQHLQEISDFVSREMLPRQPHFPITGENAARHTSGGHTNAILKNPLAYQPFDPKEVGNEISFIFGPLSGGNHAKAIIDKAHYRCDDSEKAEIAQYIKTVHAERRKGITDSELLATYIEYRNPMNIQDFSYSKQGQKTILTLQGKFFSEEGAIEVVYEGQDSALAALNDRILEYFPDFTIESYQSQSAEKGISARSLTVIVIKTKEGQIYTGESINKDIEISAFNALISAVNQAYVEKNYFLNKSEK